MTQNKKEELLAVLDACVNVDADIRFHPEQHYFTVHLWPENKPDIRQALELQNRLRELSKRYSHVVCYCYDAFSTLVYAI